MPRDLKQALRSAFSQPSFLTVAVILVLAAGGLNAATQFMKLHFRKLAVPLVHPLTDLPETLGPWKQVSIDQPMTHEIEEVLATTQYVFRDYVDSRMVTQEELDQFKDKTAKQRADLAMQLQLRKPGSVVNLALTYYTGLVDTVAHVPDRCITADGYEPTHYETPSWDAVKNLPGDHMLRFIVFEDTGQTHQSIAQNVAYFFNCNGQYMNDPIAVRKELANLFETYGYYMKFEAHALKLPQDQAAKVMNDLFSYAIPQAQKCLPDWKQIKATGKLPE